MLNHCKKRKAFNKSEWFSLNIWTLLHPNMSGIMEILRFSNSNFNKTLSNLIMIWNHDVTRNFIQNFQYYVKNVVTISGTFNYESYFANSDNTCRIITEMCCLLRYYRFLCHFQTDQHWSLFQYIGRNQFLTRWSI